MLKKHFDSPLAILSVVLALAGAYMAYQFGHSLATGWDAFWTGTAFAAFALTAFFMLDKAFDLYEAGQKSRGHLAAAVFIACASINSIGTWSFSATNRIATSTAADVVNVRWDGADKAAREAEELYAALSANLTKVDEAAQWAATATADGLRSQLAAMEGDKVFKRSKKCTNVTIAESRAFCDKRADIQERIATVEQRSELLAKRDKAKAAADSARERRDALPKEVASATVSKNIIAAAYDQAMNPSEESGFWSTLFLAALVAFMLETLPGVIKALSREGRAAAVARVFAPPAPPKPAPSTTIVEERHNHHWLDLLAEKAIAPLKVA